MGDERRETDVSTRFGEDIANLQRFGWTSVVERPQLYKELLPLIMGEDADTLATVPARRQLVQSVLTSIISLEPDPDYHAALIKFVGLGSSDQDMLANRRLKRAAQAIREGASTADGIRRVVSKKVTPHLDSALQRWADGDRPVQRPDEVAGHSSLDLIDHLLEAQNAAIFQDFAVVPALRELVKHEISSSASYELLYLHANAHLLLGNLVRDMGILNGSHDAHWHYQRAEHYGRAVNASALVARVSLLRDGVLKEMSAGPKGGLLARDELNSSLRSYFFHESNLSLSPENRGWAYVWAGSVLTKLDCAKEARKHILIGIQMLRDNGNAAISAQFKLAGVELAVGNFAEASAAMQKVALPKNGSVLQRVRRDRRRAQVLLNIKETFDEGASLLEATLGTAGRASLGHQVQSINATARDFKLQL